MPNSVVQTKRLTHRIAVILVVLTTAFAIIASGLKAMDDNTYEVLHTLSLVVMLSAYIFFVATMASKRQEPVPQVHYTFGNGTFSLYPMESDRIVRISPHAHLAKGVAPLNTIPRDSKNLVRAVVVRGATIDLPFVKMLSEFPNIVALDVQDCRVQPEVWNAWVHFDYLRLILAHGAMKPGEWRDLSLGMPEIKICIEPSQLGAVTESNVLPAA